MSDNQKTLIPAAPYGEDSLDIIYNNYIIYISVVADRN